MKLRRVIERWWPLAAALALVPLYELALRAMSAFDAVSSLLAAGPQLSLTVLVLVSTFVLLRVVLIVLVPGVLLAFIVYRLHDSVVRRWVHRSLRSGRKCVKERPAEGGT